MSTRKSRKKSQEAVTSTDASIANTTIASIGATATLSSSEQTPSPKTESSPKQCKLCVIAEGKFPARIYHSDSVCTVIDGTAVDKDKPGSLLLVLSKHLSQPEALMSTYIEGRLLPQLFPSFKVHQKSAQDGHWRMILVP